MSVLFLNSDDARMVAEHAWHRLPAEGDRVLQRRHLREIRLEFDGREEIDALRHTITFPV